MNIKMKPCASSNVAATGYDEASQTLQVQFRNGSTYQYPGVAPATAENLGAGGSIGKDVSAIARAIKGVRLPE